jgi:hypothetical protein
LFVRWHAARASRLAIDAEDSGAVGYAQPVLFNAILSDPSFLGASPADPR